jgi:hypothetical protein
VTDVSCEEEIDREKEVSGSQAGGEKVLGEAEDCGAEARSQEAEHSEAEDRSAEAGAHETEHGEAEDRQEAEHCEAEDCGA